MGKSEKKSDIVYKEIKRMIIEGELKPMTDISEDEFSRYFQTSRTPVHEAIMKLEEEGFVYVYPRKGTFVSAISLAEMQHVYEIRMLTEPTLIRHACKVISDEKLDELKAQLTISTEHMSEAEYIKYFTDLDNKLHTMILECSDNEFIKVAMYRAYDHQHRARIRIASKPREFARAIEDHIEIVDAIKERNEEKAIEAIQKHLIQGKIDFSRMDYMV